MKRTLIHVSVVAMIVSACTGKEPFTRQSGDGHAESVYLTNDHNNDPVVVWTERHDETLTLFYAVSKDNGQTFPGRITIPLSPDVATHPESMPKVAFDRSGQVFVAYEKKNPTNENKYAGAVYYRFSSDQGNTWSREMFLHSDTTAGLSRSYFDIERLPDGTIGAAWLDIKIGHETGGRSVRFAKTLNAHRFEHEILVDSSACQCCRIDVYSDITGKVNIAYRGLMKGHVGQSVRDIMLATSGDNGQTFSQPERVSQDNWAIDGCPHTGASLCSNKSGLFSFWYTEGNGTGIYYSFKSDTDPAFRTRQLVSSSGRRPQLSVNDSRVVMVWEENAGTDERNLTHIHYQIGNDTGIRKLQLTPDDANAYLPVATYTSTGFVIAFLMEHNDHTGMYTAKVD